jgi:hypothetical protein
MGILVRFLLERMSFIGLTKQVFYDGNFWHGF